MTAIEAISGQGGARTHSGLLAAAMRVFRASRARRARRAAMQALLEFDDAQLSDIGLTREDIRRAAGL